MIDASKLFGCLLVPLFRSRAAFQAEIVFLHHQLLVLKQSVAARVRLRNRKQLISIWLYRLFSSLPQAAIILELVSCPINKLC